jgi:asparagine synthase (glutamine-hydrolysing)
MVGIFSTEPLDPEDGDSLVTLMARDIVYGADDAVTTWSDDSLAVAQVSRGVSTTQTQPVLSEDGGLSVVMDGEIFDYDRERRALEDRGHCFRHGQSDAEYCLHLYEEYGTDALAKLNGCFALLIYDRAAGELILASDRFASYPLYYYHGGATAVFGTQLRPLLRFERLPRRLDIRGVFEFFVLSRVLLDHTFYQDVKALEPASVLRIRGSDLGLSRYWRPTYGDQGETEAYYVDALVEALRQAVARKTRGNDRLGILLSGGLDSRTVLACCDRPLVAFTLADFDNREVAIARRVAEVAGFEHVFLERDLDHYANLVEEAVEIGDGMRRFDHAHVLGSLQDIKARCDVVLDALNFDTRLKGSHLIYRQPSWLGASRTPMLERLSGVDRLETWQKVRGYRSACTVRDLFNPPYSDAVIDVLLTSLRESAAEADTDVVQNAVEYPMGGSVGYKGVHMMALAVRSQLHQRSVIADNDLWSLSLSIPPRLRANGRVLKKALRRISPALAALPYSNTGLRADLPPWPEWLLLRGRGVLRRVGLVSRPQLPHPAFSSGPWPNRAELIRQNAKLKGLMEQTLRDPACIDPDLFDVRAVDTVLEQHLNRKADHTTMLCSLLTFGQWYRDYGPK